MRTSDRDMFTKYQSSRKALNESDAVAQKMLQFGKALGHLEGAVLVELGRLKGAQVELNSGEVNQTIKNLQDALNTAKQMAPQAPIETSEQK